MTLAFHIVNNTIKGLTRLFCRIDDAQFERIPTSGPLILVANHINFLEVPLMYTHLQPRPIAGFSKIENWENPFLKYIFNLWGAIPLQRGEADIDALKQALAALAAGKILAIAPEGTRSGNGLLQRGRPGVVPLALRSGAPLLPIVYYGGENFRRNVVRMRRTDFHISVGQPFYVKTNGVKVSRQVRQQIVDEIMYQIAALLPQAYRGCYSNLGAASETFLYFPDSSLSNLRRALN